MGRKYLEDIGITDRPDMWNTWELHDEKEKEWEEMREIYGFDERETWDIRTSFHLWLYERLKMFLEVCNFGLDDDNLTFNFYDKRYTLRQMINMALERLEFSFSSEYDNSDLKQYSYVADIERIFEIIISCLWW